MLKNITTIMHASAQASIRATRAQKRNLAISSAISSAICTGVILATNFAAQASNAPGAASLVGADKMHWEEPHAAAWLLKNVSLPEAKPGSVIASPAKREPNYYFHWVRDGALTMLSIEGLEKHAKTQAEHDQYRKILFDYVGFSQDIQKVAEASNSYAEARFQIDGSISHDGWASPQIDGPALRAVSLIKFANLLLDEGNTKFVNEQLYRAEIPAMTAIKKDLEFTAHHWREASYDVWEESFGSHFYHYMVQRRALVEGAALAARLGDMEASGFYKVTAAEIGQAISQFYDPKLGYIVASLNKQSGVSYKASNLDSVVVLAVVHGATDDGFMKASDDRVLQTVNRLEHTFGELYAINTGAKVASVGRYPEDRYDGANSNSAGNPWFLTTFAMAELYAKLAGELQVAGSIVITAENVAFYKALLGAEAGSLQVGTKIGSRSGAAAGAGEAGSGAGAALRGTVSMKLVIAKALDKANDFMDAALSHMNQTTGQMSEQFHRSSGFMQGANDLTWSYASFFTANWAITEARAKVPAAALGTWYLVQKRRVAQ